MSLIVEDPFVSRSLIEERRRQGHDRHDEVWEGAYIIMPLPNIEHQKLVAGIVFAITDATKRETDPPDIFPGVNVSDRIEDWEFNFRCPDVAAYLSDNPAQNCGAHWFGGPDFAVEIISPHDRSREKLDFYAAVGTRELLLIDRDPWRLELYRLDDGELKPQGESTPGNSLELAGEVLPLSWRLLPGEPRPQIELTHADGDRWIV